MAAYPWADLYRPLTGTYMAQQAVETYGWLKPGETVTVSVEGLGALTNPVIAE